MLHFFLVADHFKFTYVNLKWENELFGGLGFPNGNLLNPFMCKTKISTAHHWLFSFSAANYKIIFQRFRSSRSATVCGNYFVYVCISLCSHVEKITTWQDPRKTMVASMNQMSLLAQATSNNGGVQGRSMALSQPNLGEDLQLHSNSTLSGILLSLTRLWD